MVEGQLRDERTEWPLRAQVTSDHFNLQETPSKEPFRLLPNQQLRWLAEASMSNQQWVTTPWAGAWQQSSRATRVTCSVRRLWRPGWFGKTLKIRYC
jgi:hypothetical protein